MPPPSAKYPFPDTVPRNFGKYRLESVLGEGAMGIVFRASFASGGVTFQRALKVVKFDRLRELDSLAAEAFREAGALVGVENENIVRVNDVGTIDGIPFLELELLKGVTLDRLVGRLSLGEAQHILLDMARGLAALHESNRIHRDIKPTNVFVTTEGRAKLMDLGIAKDLSGTESTRGIKGTPRYMAPEQRLAAAGVRSDVFAWGAVAWELYSGAPLLDGKTESELEVQRVTVDDRVRELRVADARAEGFTNSEAFFSLVAGCLWLDERKRPTDGQALVDALEPLVTASALRGVKARVVEIVGPGKTGGSSSGSSSPNRSGGGESGARRERSGGASEAASGSGGARVGADAAGGSGGADPTYNVGSGTRKLPKGGAASGNRGGPIPPTQPSSAGARMLVGGVGALGLGAIALLVCGGGLLALMAVLSDPGSSASAEEEPFAIPATGIAGLDWESPTLGTMQWVEGGTFVMGTPDSEPGHHDSEAPLHTVSVRGFLLMEHEVTQGEWKAVMGSSPARATKCGRSCPVESITWDEAQQFATRVSERDGVNYRLPSESEWEFAARGGRSGGLYAGGSDPELVGWVETNSGATPHTVCTALIIRNEFDLCDMTGNVMEWTQDGYHDAFFGAPEDGSSWDGFLKKHTVRGGGWGSDASEARVGNRMFGDEKAKTNQVGVRLARSMP